MVVDAEEIGSKRYERSALIREIGKLGYLACWWL